MEQRIKQYGKPVNSKSLLSFICQQMLKLDNDEITVEKAVAQSKLASQAHNLLNYELKRTIVQLKMHEVGVGTEMPQLRNIESKPFSSEIKEHTKNL